MDKKYNGQFTLTDIKEMLEDDNMERGDMINVLTELTAEVETLQSKLAKAVKSFKSIERAKDATKERLRELARQALAEIGRAG